MSNAEITSTIGSVAPENTTQAHDSLLKRVEHTLAGGGQNFTTVMEAIGRDCLKALASVQTYLPAATAIATAIFPADTAAVAGVTSAITLIENAVATIEAKWAAGDKSAGNGAQKLADVLSLVESSVIDLLGPVGIHVDKSYVTRLVNIVVSILNIRTTTAVTAPA